MGVWLVGRVVDAGRLSSTSEPLVQPMPPPRPDSLTRINHAPAPCEEGSEYKRRRCAAVPRSHRYKDVGSRTYVAA